MVGTKSALFHVSILAAFACASSSPAGLVQTDPTALRENEAIKIEGYTTKDGIHHACAECTARFVREVSPDGAAISHLLIGKSPGADPGPAKFCTGGKCPPAVEESLVAAEVASLDVTEHERR
jgi:hypothetical protein